MNSVHIRGAPMLKMFLTFVRGSAAVPEERSLPLGWWAKGYLAMVVQSCITVATTVRDMHEASRLVDRIEDARTERLLMDAAKPAL
ncbi:MAG: hypothetical protein EOP23_21490 [Hyphomicrobiales bacterium]|nr:MAG: hypothetical protein EOP23_21490 [Hyphomicrobiales bacterium]